MTPPSADIRLSIVVAASNDPGLLGQCLASLKGQGEAADTEVIVASNYAGADGAVAAHLPGAVHLALPETTTVPMLRTHGIRRARGAIIALAEDHCTFDPAWCEAVKAAHALPHAVVGGTVENRTGPAPQDWATYFFEYGAFMAPNRAGTVGRLAGNNASYKREALEAVQEAFEDGFYETFMHQALQQRGHALYLAPAAVVYHVKHYDTATVFRQCYHHGRAFAAMRAARAPRIARMGLTLGALGLPVLLPARIALHTLRKGRHRRELLRALPHLVLFMSSWALGEGCGYAAGVGGSAAQWT